MITLNVEFITGVVVGLEFASGEDIDEPDVSLALAIDLAIIRLVFTIFKDPPVRPA